MVDQHTVDLGSTYALTAAIRFRVRTRLGAEADAVQAVMEYLDAMLNGTALEDAMKDVLGSTGVEFLAAIGPVQSELRVDKESDSGNSGRNPS